MKFETTILRNLLYNEPYLRQVLPFLKEEYFTDPNERRVFLAICAFVEEYNVAPTTEALTIILDNDHTITAGDIAGIKTILVELREPTEDVVLKWLVDSTEQFVKDKAIFLAVQDCIVVMAGNDPKRTKDALPDIMKEALSVGFDNSVGHNYFGDSDKRFEKYTDVDERLRFDIDWLNLITNGGIPRKKLCIITGAINIGKTLMLCHLAAAYISMGRKVLYITLEISDTDIAQRVDANLLNIAVNDLVFLPPDEYKVRMQKLRDKTGGDLFVKEYPSGSAHAGHFRALVSELALKQKFVPDVIMVDMIDLCASSRMKRGDNTNSYIKSVAQELRGLSQETNTVMWSASQFTRSGMEDSDPSITDTAYAIGLPETADLDLAVTQNETLEKLNQYLIKQLKNRLNSKSQHKRFVIGVDTAKMRLYNCDWAAQKSIVGEQDEPKFLPAPKPPVKFSRDTGEIYEEART